MNSQMGDVGTGQVSAAVASWLNDVGQLLKCVQLVLDHAQPAAGAPAEVGALMPQLSPLIRECRSQIPSADMIDVWVRQVTGRVGAPPENHDPAVAGSEAGQPVSTGRAARELIAI